MNAESYYELTEDTYFSLCPEGSAHMNMGLWPAPSIRAAQEKLISEVLDFHTKNNDQTPRAIIDAGSGWGGSRAIFERKFPTVTYIGINSSAKQIAYARRLHQGVPETFYYHADIRDIASLDLIKADTLISIEAAFHFQGKDELFNTFASHGLSMLTLADICVEDKSILRDYPLLHPALGEAWSSRDYERVLRQNRYSTVSVDVSDRVFSQWSRFLQSLGPSAFPKRRRLLHQFQEGFSQMAELSQRGLLRYMWFHASQPRAGR